MEEQQRVSEEDEQFTRHPQGRFNHHQNTKQQDVLKESNVFVS